MKYKSHNNILQLLKEREYGFTCNNRKKLECLRNLICSSNRTWRLSFIKESRTTPHIQSDILVYNSKEIDTGKTCLQVSRLLETGMHDVLYKFRCHYRIIDMAISSYISTLYDSSLPRKEYRPFLFILHASNILVRFDLIKGSVYDKIKISSAHKFIHLHLLEDRNRLILQSTLQKCINITDNAIALQVYNIRPFQLYKELVILGTHFPAKTDKKIYGGMANIEILKDVLLVMTKKSYILFYSLLKIFEYTDKDIPDPPPLLHVVKTHARFLAVGGHPWTCVTAINNNLFKVNFLNNDHDNARDDIVQWNYSDCDAIITSRLLFHSDDTNRLIFSCSSDFKMFSLEENGQEYYIKEFFEYPQMVIPSPVAMSRSRGVVGHMYTDTRDRRALVYDYEDELELLAILECVPYDDDQIELKKITFYDNLSMKLVKEQKIGETVAGYVGYSNISMHFDRDIINITVKSSSTTIILHFTLICCSSK